MKESGSQSDRDPQQSVLKYPQATFTVSFSLPASERFQLIGTQGEFEASPCFGFGEGVAILDDNVADGRVAPANEQAKAAGAEAQ